MTHFPLNFVPFCHCMNCSDDKTLWRGLRIYLVLQILRVSLSLESPDQRTSTEYSNRESPVHVCPRKGFETAISEFEGSHTLHVFYRICSDRMPINNYKIQSSICQLIVFPQFKCSVLCYFNYLINCLCFVVRVCLAHGERSVVDF
jgi:hypothetical protein